MGLQPVSALEKSELHKEGAACHLAPGLLDETAARLHGSSRGEQVIDQQNVRAGDHAVDMYLQLGAAVLKVVLQRMGPVGELARLAKRDQRTFHEEGQRSREQETAGLGSGHRIDPPTLIVLAEQVDRL